MREETTKREMWASHLTEDIEHTGCLRCSFCLCITRYIRSAANGAPERCTCSQAGNLITNSMDCTFHVRLLRFLEKSIDTFEKDRATLQVSPADIRRAYSHVFRGGRRLRATAEKPTSTTQNKPLICSLATRKHNTKTDRPMQSQY